MTSSTKQNNINAATAEENYLFNQLRQLQTLNQSDSQIRRNLEEHKVPLENDVGQSSDQNRAKYPLSQEGMSIEAHGQPQAIIGETRTNRVISKGSEEKKKDIFASIPKDQVILMDIC